MKPYTPATNLGRTRAQDDIHHRTADQPREAAVATAKAARHGARQDGKAQVTRSLVDEARAAEA